MDILVIAADRGAGHLWKRGDICEVRPTGKAWGGEETLPPINGGLYARIRLLRDDDTPIWSVGEDPPARMLELIDTDGSITTDEFGMPVVSLNQYRIWNILVDTLPVNVRTQLNQTGIYEVRWSTVRTFIQNKITLQSPDNEVVG